MKMNILKTGELFTIYKNYLPRTNTLSRLKLCPDLEEYFQNSKFGVNQLNKFQLDPLISERGDLDWFRYDDESLKFLIDMEKADFNVIEMVKYCDDQKIYFQDLYPYVTLSNRECKSYYITLSMMDITIKMESTLMNTFYDLLKKLNLKLDKIRPELCFEIEEKILKVHSLK